MTTPRAIAVLVCLITLASHAVCAQMRGAWVTGWGPGFFTAAQADATVKAAKDAGLNALFIQVRKQADAYYNSSLEPRSTDIAAGYDPLAYIIEKAHAQGIQIHAWINIFRVWRGSTLPADAGYLANVYPDWLTKSFTGQTRASEGFYLDPGVPEVREHNAAVAAEIARNYKVDGIHLDYIRYPGRDWGYADAALSRYYAETGETVKPEPTSSVWLDWRRKQVTEQVRLIRERVKAANPNVVLSAATIAWGDCPSSFADSAPYKKVCQDWNTWLEAGLLDANVLMNYRTEKTAEQARQYRLWLAALKKWSGGRPAYAGIGVYMNKPVHSVNQIAAARKAGVDGFVLFSFNAGADRTALIKALKRR